MKTVPADPPPPHARDPILDDPALVVAVAVRAFAAAKRAAIEENDRLGLPCYGGKDGKIIVRHPPKPTP